MYSDTTVGIVIAAIYFAILISNFILGLITYYNQEIQDEMNSKKYSEILNFIKWTLYIRISICPLLCLCFVCIFIFKYIQAKLNK